MLPQIQIVQTWGRIGIAYRPQQWEIHAPPAELSIEAPAAVLEIHTIPGQLDIDQTEAFADEGLRRPLEFTEYEAQQARQAAAEGTAEAAQWGQRFLHIEQGDAFPAWVMRYRDKVREAVPALVPRPFSVHIHYQPGGVDIHAHLQPVRVQAQVQPVSVSFSPGSAHVYLEQRPQVQVIPPPVGQLLDVRI